MHELPYLFERNNVSGPLGERNPASPWLEM